MIQPATYQGPVDGAGSDTMLRLLRRHLTISLARWPRNDTLIDNRPMTQDLIPFSLPDQSGIKTS